MIGYHIGLIFRGISIYRWNNFPRIENITTNDNLAFVLHTATLLSHIIEEKEGKKVDLFHIYKKVMVEAFDTYILSDINSDVKYRIRQKNPYMLKLLQEKVQGFIVNVEIPENVREDFIAIYQNEKNPQYELEQAVFQYSKLWVSYYEANFNNKIYPDVYEPVLNNLKQRMNRPENKMFRKYLDIDNRHNELEKFLLNIRRLQFSQRWNRSNRSYQITVMSHLYITFFLAYVIGRIEKKSDAEVSLMMKIALFHDIPEAITGDIVAPTKKAVNGFEELIGEVEKDMLEEYLLHQLDGFACKKDFAKYMLQPWDGENGRLIKFADVFSALFEARIEVPHTREYNKTYKNIKRYLHTQTSPSVDYLLKFGVDYFDDNIEDIIKL